MSGEPDPRMAAFSSFTVKTHCSATTSPILQSQGPLPESVTVLIIGASTGIGEQIVYAYADSGVGDIIICSRTVADLELVAAKVRTRRPQARVHAVAADIVDPESVSRLKNVVVARCGRLDILILSAGWSNPNACMGKASPQDVRRAFEINTIGTYNIAYSMVPLLLTSDNGAKIFLTIGSGSSAIRRGPFANPGYSISKMAQARMVEYMAEHYGAQGLMSIAVDPGTVATRMSLGLLGEEFRKFLKDDSAICGAVCVWLCRNSSNLTWLNGRMIYATWDLEELLSYKDEVVEKDLLKFGMITS